MRKEPKSLTFEEFADELMDEVQPRAVVILAAAKVDNVLRQILESFLYPKPAKQKDDELFDGDTPLSAFSARIKMSRRLGLIDEPLAAAFDKLRGIRNQAAHWVSFEIKDSPLREQLADLNATVASRKSYQLTVKKFFGDDGSLSDHQTFQATLLTLCVLAASIQEYVQKQPLAKLMKLKKIN